MNASENISIPLDEEWWENFRSVRKTFYDITVGLSCIGFVGNLISLLAFIRLRKTSSPYIHQILIIGTDFASILLSFEIYFADGYCEIFKNNAPRWIQSSVLLYILYLGYPFVNMLTVTSGIQLNCISLDRLQAMYMEVRYKAVNQGRRALYILVLSLTLGILSTLHDCWRMRLEWDEGLQQYWLLVNEDWVVKNPLSRVLGLVRIGLRCIIMVSLLVLASLIAYTYRKRTLGTNSQMGSTGKQTGLVSHRALTLLLLSQALLNLIGQGGLLAYYTAFYVFKLPRTSKTIQVLNVVVQFTGTFFISSNFLVYFATSAEFRRGTWEMLGLKKWTSSSVAPAH